MPGRDCDTCKFWRPYEGLLVKTFARCDSPNRGILSFAETIRGDDSQCGPTARWWEGKPPRFELVEDEGGRKLAWDEDDGRDED